MIIVQLILYCALFTLMVKLGVGNSALNGLFFYPKPVQDKVYALGLTDRETVGRKRKRFIQLVQLEHPLPLILCVHARARGDSHDVAGHRRMDITLITTVDRHKNLIEAQYSMTKV